jgi:hypothetical protein
MLKESVNAKSVLKKNILTSKAIRSADFSDTTLCSLWKVASDSGEHSDSILKVPFHHTTCCGILEDRTLC